MTTSPSSSLTRLNKIFTSFIVNVFKLDNSIISATSRALSYKTPRTLFAGIYGIP